MNKFKIENKIIILKTQYRDEYGNKPEGNQLIEVILKQYINGSGWSCASTIDNIVKKENISLQEQCEEYAKEYFSNLQIEEDEDFQITFTHKDEIAKSYFATYYIEF